MPTITENDDATLPFALEEDDGTALDIATVTTIEVLLASYAAATPWLRVTDSDASLTVTDSSNGEFEVDITQADTANRGDRNHHLEVRIKRSGEWRAVYNSTASGSDEPLTVNPSASDNG